MNYNFLLHETNVYSSIAYSLIIDTERKTRSKKEREKVRYGGIKKERDDSERDKK